jgi:hypothetical protein
MPEGLADHLQMLYEMNEDRNRSILAQIERINKALNAHNIYPIYLKGTANLMDGLYPTPGERIIGDIDFLVSPDCFLQAAEVLMGEGYYPQKEYEIFNSEIKHYPRLTHSVEIADVEIHAFPVSIRYKKSFNTAQIESNKIGNTKYGSCSVPSDVDKLRLVFYHAHFSDNGYAYKSYLLRSLFDAYLLFDRPLLKLETERLYKKHSANFFAIVDALFGYNCKINCCLIIPNYQL